MVVIPHRHLASCNKIPRLPRCLGRP